ncbi:MAG: MotA/TolQ/ExbB proton channel family protein [Planctomycetota bacterium]
MLLSLFQRGGPIMWPLLFCSILLGGLLLERLWTVVIRKHVLQQDVTYAHLRAHRRSLPFFTDVPPALGLLGTVVGLVQSFALLDDSLAANGVGAGLATACITTVFGLIIAITASAANYTLCLFDHAEDPVPQAAAAPPPTQPPSSTPPPPRPKTVAVPAVPSTPAPTPWQGPTPGQTATASTPTLTTVQPTRPAA